MLSALGVFRLKSTRKIGDRYHLKSVWNAVRTISVCEIYFVSYVREREKSNVLSLGMDQPL